MPPKTPLYWTFHQLCRPFAPLYEDPGPFQHHPQLVNPYSPACSAEMSVPLSIFPCSRAVRRPALRVVVARNRWAPSMPDDTREEAPATPGGGGGGGQGLSMRQLQHSPSTPDLV